MAMGISTQSIPCKPSCPPLVWLSSSCPRSSYTSRSFWASSRKPPNREGVCRYHNASGPFSNTMGSNSSLQINQSSHINRFSFSENHGYCEGYYWKLEARNSIARMVAQLPNQKNSNGKLHSDSPQLMEVGKKRIPKDLASAAWIKAANEIKTIKGVSSGDCKKDPMDSEILLAETTARSGQYQYGPTVVHDGSAYVESNGYMDSSLEFGNSSRERPLGTPNGQLKMGRPGSIKKDTSSGSPTLDNNATKSYTDHQRGSSTTAKSGQYQYDPMDVHDGTAYVESNGYTDYSLEFGNSSRERPLGTPNGQMNMGRPGSIKKDTSSGPPTLDNNATKSSTNHRRSSSNTSKSEQYQYGPMVVQNGSAYVESNGYIDSSLEFGNSSRERPLGTPNGQLNMGRPGSIKKDTSSGSPTLDNNATKSPMNHRRSSSPSKGTKANGLLSGELSNQEMEKKSVKPLNGSFTDEEQGFHQIDSLKRLACIYDKVLVVDNIDMARKTVWMLKNQYRHHVYACDTEVAKIDVKQETPVDHGEIICFSIYSEPELNFGNGKSCIWVDVLAGGGKNILAEFAPFFEDSSIKKVWHNYSFDNHIIENYGLKVSGFHADTMHMARLWDSSRRTVGGYSLEALTGDLRVCHDKNLIGKVSMKTIFGRRKVKKDGSEGKILTIPAVEDLQRENRMLWICYSAFDSISTLKLYESLKCKLLREEWKVDGHKKGSMFEFYEKYWQPFGELLVRMETEGMLVDRAYLAEIEKVARAEQQTAANRFRNWASKYCPDAKYMNVGSDAQLRQLFFGGILNSKDLNESLPVEREFKVPNVENIIEEGKKTPSKFRNIKLHSLGPVLQTEMYTATGWPSVSIDALKTLAGKVSSEFDFTGEAPELQSDDIIENSAGMSETKGGNTKGRDSAYGTAYDAFGRGQEGKEACHAIAALCEVCAIDSLISNFILPLQGGHISGKHGRIHCSLNINTETGRLSARRPNLQNQPALEKDRYKIRQAFIAAPGNSLIVADYGQLELRILAHLADCKSMLAAFKAGGDFHSRTAMNMYPHIREAVEKKHVLLEWHPQPGEVKPPVPLLKDAFASERRKAKMLNFSIAYGKTPVGLARDWKVSVKEAKETVDLWYNERQEVRDWQEERKKEARKDRCVHTLLGRARRFPSMDNVSPYQKGHIERAAINTPVQGSAADVAMCAMLEISNNARLKELGWRLLLQVHDEVILEGPTESAEEAKAIVVGCMSKPFDGKNFLKVDLSVDAKCAQNWYAAK